MNKEKPKVQSIVESLFLVAIEKLKKEDAAFSSNLYVQLELESGEVHIYNEQEGLLKKKIIFEWVGSNKKDKIFGRKMIDTLKNAIGSLAGSGLFEHPVFIKPFVVSLTDEEFRVIEELYAIEEDYMLPEGGLLKNLEDDLNDFFEKLLLDVE